MIVNTAGWDTDCNSGNVGCLLGIKNGLAGIDAGPDWRGPVADRMYLPTADGGRAITDAVQRDLSTWSTCGRALAGAAAARAQGRRALPLRAARRGAGLHGAKTARGARRRHGRERARPQRSRHPQPGPALPALAPGRSARVATATFIPPEAIEHARLHAAGLANAVPRPDRCGAAQRRCRQRDAGHLPLYLRITAPTTSWSASMGRRLSYRRRHVVTWHGKCRIWAASQSPRSASSCASPQRADGACTWTR